MNERTTHALDSLAAVHFAPLPSPDDIGGPADSGTIGARVRVQQQALLEIMKSGALTGPLAQAFALLTEVTGKTLGVARVSIWRYGADADVLELLDLFDRHDGSHRRGATLQAASYPAYFAALRRNRVIVANDALRDPNTREFAADYLLPLSIESMLDATIWHGSDSFGVVCIESVRERRLWAPDEQQFAGSIADLTALAIENDANREAQSRLNRSEERFSQLFRLSPDWMVVTREADGVVLEINESFEKQSGYSAAEIVGRTTADIGLWVSAEQRAQWLDLVRRDGSVANAEADLRLKSGEQRTFQFSTARIAVDGDPCFISVGHDTTDRRRQERLVFDLAQSLAGSTGESFFRSLVECLRQALDADVALIGEITGAEMANLRVIAVETADGPGGAFEYALAGTPCATLAANGACVYPDQLGQLFPQAPPEMRAMRGYAGAPLLDSSGKLLGLIAVMFRGPIGNGELASQLLRIFATRAAAEIERRRQLLQLEQRASHDALTTLINRATLERNISAAIDDGSAGAQGALLMIDLDRFKEINDTLGHTVGDGVLVGIAQRLAAANAGDGAVSGEVARFGGDEFAIWLKDLEAPHVAELVATRALNVITAPLEAGDFRLEVNASVGIALYPQHGASASELMRCADIAMYVAKRKGVGYGRYDPQDDRYSPKRLALMSDLAEAVRAGQLELHFQPRLHLKGGTPSGFEALVRWRHPVLGVISPAEFIPLAELTDVIRPLTLWVLDTALAQQAAWAAAGFPVTIAVNLSARHLMDEACPHQVRRLLEKHRVDPMWLELEITESAIIVDPERATTTLRHIHAMGVKLSIDDFGTGYSSLSHLKRLPLHALKIDVSFVTHMLSNEQDAVIVESTIGLAHNLGLAVVAEGIEDAATLARLGVLNCDEGQGYFIGRPLSPARATDWLAAAGVN